MFGLGELVLASVIERLVGGASESWCSNKFSR